MARNIEIKARIPSVEALLPEVAALANAGPTEILQDDVFFHCLSGRLKLRRFPDGGGELIFYRRPDLRGPKESFHLRTRTSDAATLRESLRLAYGECGRVVKRRVLFVAGRTRIHLDRVEALGDFLELEVVLEETEDARSGIGQAEALMEKLGLEGSDLVEGAYVDLLAAKGVAGVSNRGSSEDDP